MRQTYTRRSFLARVAGTGALIAAGAGAARAQPQNEERRRMVVDADPSDPAREPDEAAAEPDSAQTQDRDAGPNSDPHGQGRPSPESGPRERFILCPGNSRCPR